MAGAVQDAVAREVDPDKRILASHLFPRFSTVVAATWTRTFNQRIKSAVAAEAQDGGDHVVFIAKPDGEPWSPRRIMERLTSFAAKWRKTAICDDGTTATLSVSWFEDNYHRIEALASHRAGEWLVRHHGPPRLGDTLHDWLHHDPHFDAVRWQTKAEWKAQGPSQPKPW